MGPLATARCVGAPVLARGLCIAAGGEAGGEAGQAPPLLGPIPRPRCRGTRTPALWAPRCAPPSPLPAPHTRQHLHVVSSAVDGQIDRRRGRASSTPSPCPASASLPPLTATRAPPLARARRCPPSGGALRGSRPQDDRAPRAQKVHGPRLGTTSPIYNWFILMKERGRGARRGARGTRCVRPYDSKAVIFGIEKWSNLRSTNRTVIPHPTSLPTRTTARWARHQRQWVQPAVNRGENQREEMGVAVGWVRAAGGGQVVY